jgi:hypothetical protein
MDVGGELYTLATLPLGKESLVPRNTLDVLEER